MRTFLALILFLLLTTRALAQTAPSWLEDTLYAGGKMNAVVAVVGIIILGIGVWLWMQDRRLRSMEERIRRSEDQKIR